MTNTAKRIANKDDVTAPLGIDAYHSDAPLSDPSQDDFDRWPFGSVQNYTMNESHPDVKMGGD